MPKRKRGPQSFKAKSQLPKYASQRTQLQDERNDLRENSTLRVIRWGFKLAWGEAPSDMRRYGVGTVGSFDRNNCHDGICWGWPRECKLTNKQAKTIMLRCWKRKRLTLPMMKAVRKSMAYAFELTGGKPGDNFPGVNEVFSVVVPSKLPKSATTTLPDRVPTASELKKAFTTEWTVDSRWSFLKDATGRLFAHDCFLGGLRSREDVRKLKESVTHTFDWEAGWQCSDFVGGRSKLCGIKKGTRPWNQWTTCFCPSAKHQRPPADFYTKIDANGNPTEPVPFPTTCPLALLELIWQLQDSVRVPRRRYGKWLDTGRFGVSNHGDVVKHAIDWFETTGVCGGDTRYDTNAGRKALGVWTSHLRIEYEVSFQLHGDLWCVWSKHYETSVPKSDFNTRKQSTVPAVACLGLRRLGNWFGFGKKVKRKLSTQERYMHHILVGQGKNKLAQRIRDGLPSSDEESDD